MMNEAMKYAMSAAVAIGAAGLKTDRATQPERQPNTLVADWSAADDVGKITLTQSEIAAAQAKLAGEASPFNSYIPKQSDADTCDCDCLSESQMREIVRSEIAVALRDRMNGTASSGGSTGGSVAATTNYVSYGDTKYINGREYTLQANNGTPMWMPTTTTATHQYTTPTGSVMTCANGQCSVRSTVPQRRGLFGWRSW